jgi:PAS domain S-box-containing protein
MLRITKLGRPAMRLQCLLQPELAENLALGVLSLGRTARVDVLREEGDIADVIDRIDGLRVAGPQDDLYRDLIDAMPDAAWTADTDGRLTLVTRRWAEHTGVSPALGASLAADTSIHPDDRDALALHWQASLESGQPLEVTCRLRGRDGDYRWFLLRAVPRRGRDGEIAGWTGTSTDVHDAHERDQFLVDAVALLSSSLDYETTIERVAALAVPTIADWCSIDLVDADGHIDRLAIAHIDPAKVRLAQELLERNPPNPDATTGVVAVIRSGKSEYVRDIPASAFEAIEDPELRRIIDELQLRSYMCVPLIAGGEVLGALTLVSAESGRRFGEDDVALAEHLAARAASAVQNARLFRDADRFKRALDASRDTVLMFDPTTLRISYVNQGAVDQLGYDASALLSMSIALLTIDIREDHVRELLAPILDGRLKSRIVTLSMRHRSGRRLPVEVLLQHLALPDEPGRVVAIARDIEDRVQAQARLQRLAEAEHARAAELNAVIRAMGEAVVVCAADGRITLANPAASAMFGDAAARTYRELLAQFDEPSRAPSLGMRGGPVDLRVRGDAEHWVEMSTYPVAPRAADPDEPDLGETIVLLRDISEARQRQAVRDTFIGVLSHELRTPVTTIYAGSKVLARDSTSFNEDVRRSLFNDIHGEAERLHRLIEDVIALTRFGEEESEIGDEPVLLQRILPGVIRSEETRWPGVTFSLRLHAGLPTVSADATYVEQVVRNLLSNAAKYAGPAAGVEVVVESAGSEVLVRILDDGPGFPEDESDRLFDLYYRSPSTSGVASGAGIGLFVCARLIRAMGGRIWATPRPDGGAEFGFSLPVMPEY